LSGCSGRGEAIGHVGEILQGALRLGGAVEPFLITLPAPSMLSRATVEASGEWRVEPAWKTKALTAARIAARAWQWPGAASLSVSTEIPVARGYGSSTADCTAAIRAVGAMLGLAPTNAEIASLASVAEGPCDPTMFGCEPVAFLPLQGRVLRCFEGGWPVDLETEIVELGGPPVNTCEIPRPDYSAAELDEFQQLLHAAFASRDACALGRVASRSAEIHQRHRPHPEWYGLRERAQAGHAVGLAIAHSGTAAAILKRRG
jgi:uncharacterized protein involved in propanediol utilization